MTTFLKILYPQTYIYIYHAAEKKVVVLEGCYHCCSQNDVHFVILIKFFSVSCKELQNTTTNVYLQAGDICVTNELPLFRNNNMVNLGAWLNLFFVKAH